MASSLTHGGFSEGTLFPLLASAPELLPVGFKFRHSQGCTSTRGTSVGHVGSTFPVSMLPSTHTAWAMRCPQRMALVPKVPPPSSRPGLITVPLNDGLREREQEPSGFDLDSVTSKQEPDCSWSHRKVPWGGPRWLAWLQVHACGAGLAKHPR